MAIGTFFFYNQSGQIFYYPLDVIAKVNSLQVAVSPCPLLPNSLIVESVLAEKNPAKWSERQHIDAYNFLENIAALWRENESVDDFIVVGTKPPRMNGERFFWEIIPFPKDNNEKRDHFFLLWHLIFDSPCLDEKEKLVIKNRYKKYASLLTKPYVPKKSEAPCVENDPFCNQKVVNSQLLYEGKLVDLLYNYAPLGLGEDKIHFLIISKRHRDGFPDLTLEEYLEAQDILSKLTLFYEKKGFPISYYYHKTGLLAGQSVPHWHLHLIFDSEVKQAYFTKLVILRKMLLKPDPLSPEELERLVNKYKQDVKEALH